MQDHSRNPPENGSLRDVCLITLLICLLFFVFLGCWSLLSLVVVFLVLLLASRPVIGNDLLYLPMTFSFSFRTLSYYSHKSYFLYSALVSVGVFANV